MPKVILNFMRSILWVSREEKLFTAIPIKTEAKPEMAISSALLSVKKVRNITEIPMSIKIKTRG